MSRDLKKELLKVERGSFLEWYSSLSKLEKLEYQMMLEQLSKESKRK